MGLKPHSVWFKTDERESGKVLLLVILCITAVRKLNVSGTKSVFSFIQNRLSLIVSTPGMTHNSLKLSTLNMSKLKFESICTVVRNSTRAWSTSGIKRGISLVSVLHWSAHVQCRHSVSLVVVWIKLVRIMKCSVSVTYTYVECTTYTKPNH